VKVFQVSCLGAIVTMFFGMTAPKTQLRSAVNIGVAPDCPYGYYDVAPYDCAPYGYYGRGVV